MAKRKPASNANAITIDLHYGQSLAWAARETHRIVNVFAGSGGGKTWLGPRWFYPLLREGLDKTYLWIEPTYSMLKRVMIPAIQEFLGPLNIGTLKITDKIYELHGGGRILFGSTDNPNSLQGAHINGGIWCDEIGLYSEEAWDVVLQRSAFFKCPILNTSTPYTLPWVERRLARACRDPQTSDEFWMVQFPSHWNPAYPLDQYWMLKRQWPKDKFDRLMRGLFTRINGLMFEEFSEDRNLAFIQPMEDGRLYFKHPTEGERIVDLVETWMSQDWGWTDPAVQLLFGRDAEGRMYCFEEDYESRIPIKSDGGDSWIFRALNRYERWDCSFIYCDPSLPGNIDAMQSAGLPAIKANNKIDYGTDKVNEAFRPDGRGGSTLYIAQNACPNLVRTIGSYVRSKAPDGDGYLNSPAPRQDDHTEDCLRYGIVGDGTNSERVYRDAPIQIVSMRR